MRFTVFSFTILFAATAFATGPMSPARRYADIQTSMRQMAQEHPENVEVFQLGVTDSGQMLEGVKIGHGDIQNLVVATHHGNEYGSTAVAEAFAQDLAVNPIAGQTIYVIPVLNISGYDAGRRTETVGYRSYDPNRDYPGPCGTEGPFHLKSTKALADFLDRVPIVNSATLHTYQPAVLYPWGVSTSDVDTGYTDVFLELGRLATAVSGYKVGNSTADLYPADGAFEDYAYWKHGTWSLLFEMGYTHSPGENQVRQLIHDNIPGLRNLFENGPTVRAEHHEFTGKCNSFSAFLDRHDE